jgi:hypothetical protein
MLLERLSGTESQENLPLAHSSMSGLEGTLQRATPSPSPTPLEIDEDLACFPHTPSDSVHYEITEAIFSPKDQINRTIILCHAILRY